MKAKVLLISLFIIVVGTIFGACEFRETHQREKLLAEYYQEWENFVLESLEAESKKYAVTQSSDGNFDSDEHFYTNLYDKQGNTKVSSEYVWFSTRSWYILEADETGDINFDFNSVKGIQYGAQNWASGIATPVYFTNRVVNTTKFGLDGFNLSAVNGGQLHDYYYRDFSDEHEQVLRETAFPIVVGATEFMATKILSRNIDIAEETNWEYVDFEIMRVVVEFSNNFERAKVRTYNFSVRYGLSEVDKVAALDDIYNAY